MNRKTKVCILETILWLVLVVLDQLTKIQAVNALKGGNSIPLIRGVLEFYYIENRGAAFSMLQDARWFFFIVAACAITGIAYFLVKMPEGGKYRLLRLLLLLISAGAAGNLIDRVLLGYVRDFIYFSLIDFPVFNVADIYVTCSVFVLIFLVLFVYKEEDFAFMNGKKAATGEEDRRREE